MKIEEKQISWMQIKKNLKNLLGRIAKYFIIDPVENPVGLYQKFRQKLRSSNPDRQYIDKFELQSSIKENELYYLCYIDPDDVTSSLQRDLKPSQMLQTSKDSFGLTNKIDPDPDIHHVKRPKNEQKMLLCPFSRCLKQFGETGNLKTHIRSHTGERPFQCPDCSMRFITKRHMQAHQVIHTGLKPYVCNVEGCRKKYSRIGRLNIHQQSHARNNIFRCPIPDCNRAFPEKLMLMNHASDHAKDQVFQVKNQNEKYQPQPTNSTAYQVPAIVQSNRGAANEEMQHQFLAAPQLPANTIDRITVTAADNVKVENHNFNSIKQNDDINNQNNSEGQMDQKDGDVLQDDAIDDDESSSSLLWRFHEQHNLSKVFYHYLDMFKKVKGNESQKTSGKETNMAKKQMVTTCTQTVPTIDVPANHASSVLKNQNQNHNYNHQKIHPLFNVARDLQHDGDHRLLLRQSKDSDRRFKTQNHSQQTQHDVPQNQPPQMMQQQIVTTSQLTQQAKDSQHQRHEDLSSEADDGDGGDYQK